jgi:Uma2 family endonuclease
MMADPAEKRWTVEDFLVWNDGTDRRHELVDGQLVAMPPPSEAHAAIVINLGAELRSRLRLPCRVLGEAGILIADRSDTYYQADLAVTCALPDRARQHVLDPAVWSRSYRRRPPCTIVAARSKTIRGCLR